MGLFGKRYEDNDWEAGVPESFKTWFWIRLAVSLYVGYIGGDLIWRYIADGLDWWYLLLACAFIVFAIIFLIMDIRHYVRLKKHLKEKEAAEAEAERLAKETEPATKEAPEAGGSQIHKASEKQTDPVDGQERSGIRSFARYVVKDEEVDADDEV